MADERIERRLAAILAADVSGYSRLMAGVVRDHTAVTDAGYMDHFIDGLREAGLPE